MQFRIVVVVVVFLVKFLSAYIGTDIITGLFKISIGRFPQAAYLCKIFGFLHRSNTLLVHIVNICEVRSINNRNLYVHISYLKFYVSK